MLDQDQPIRRQQIIHHEHLQLIIAREIRSLLANKRIYSVTHTILKLIQLTKTIENVRPIFSSCNFHFLSFFVFNGIVD